MNQSPTRSVAVVSLALIGMLLVAGIVLVALNQADTGKSVIGVALGFAGGSGVATTVVIRNGGGTSTVPPKDPTP